MNPYVETAIRAAHAARERILARYHGEFEIEIKDDQTPVTVADREAEQAIRAVLTEAFPDHGIYGEEFGADQPDAEYLWLVDPIDGTKGFVRGTGMFSTQIALMHQGRIIAAVSSAPTADELAWAAEGEGAWLNDERLSISAVTDLADAHVSGGNLVTMAGSPRWEVLRGIVIGCNRFRAYGDYYHYHRLAAGQLDVVIESDVNVLDIAALSLLVTEAGGVFTDLEGDPVRLETTSVLAAPPALHAQLLSAFSSPAPGAEPGFSTRTDG
ncbi:inositol-phosphate phosphatase [Marinihelvus fidelis]|uniref:Nus factor SuhB n=1 Tax=Marinihelvus fidelis TaxID=2613842 RepID=A0A5N0TAY0_9GAMM|nr:inositol monophosphatase family protein [Marinihelvus fidelis]KAA9130966.1 inositol-phosphate phosphatase [Marinihelvus fidelis]